MSNNKTTEQPIAGDPYDGLGDDLRKWLNNELDRTHPYVYGHGDQYDGAENDAIGKERLLFIKGFTTCFHKLHSLAPSPVGEAGDAIGFAEWTVLENGTLQSDKRWGKVINGTGVFHNSQELYAIFSNESPNPSRAGEPLGCHSEVGMTVGLIDSLMAIAHVLVQRDWDDANISEALKDVRSDDDLKRIMDVGELSYAKEYIEEQRKSINTLSEALAFANDLLKKQTESAAQISTRLPWLTELIEMAEDGYKASVRSGAAHQEFLADDRKVLSDAKEYLRKATEEAPPTPAPTEQPAHVPDRPDFFCAKIDGKVCYSQCYKCKENAIAPKEEIPEEIMKWIGNKTGEHMDKEFPADMNNLNIPRSMEWIRVHEAYQESAIAMYRKMQDGSLIHELGIQNYKKRQEITTLTQQRDEYRNALYEIKDGKSSLKHTYEEQLTARDMSLVAHRTLALFAEYPSPDTKQQ